MTTFIGVAGGSGSGKSTLCESLRATLGTNRCTIISCDNYYRPNDALSRKEREAINYDHPSALDVDLLCSHLDLLRQGNAVQVPVYCFEKHNRLERFQSIHPPRFLIVEGILLFAEERIRRLFQHLIFVDASDSVRFQRRLHRDMRARSRTRESVQSQWQTSVLPMHEEFVEPTKIWADEIVSSEFSRIDVVAMLKKLGISNG